MTKAGIGEQTIILTIQRGPVKIDTSPQSLIALKQAGVSDQVLNAILTATAKDAGITTAGESNSAPNVGVQTQIGIKAPAEFNAYQSFSKQSDPRAKAIAGEQFLMQYPQSAVRGAVLDALIDTYQQQQNPEQSLNAATRLLQIDPNQMKALFVSVFIKKKQCAESVDSTGKAKDTQTCDDAARLASRGLQITKPASLAADRWSKQTTTAYPVFHSALALDDTVAKSDFKAGQEEYIAELKLYDDEQSQKAGLTDTLLLAQSYSQPGASQDLKQAVWFYARVWNFAPANYKAQIEPKLEYYYREYHGGLDGLDAIKQQAEASLFPPETFTITPSSTRAEVPSQGLTLRVLQEQSVPYTQEAGGGISASCNIVGTANTSAYATAYGNSAYGNATTNSNQHMTCNSYDTTIRWPHVLNVMFAQGSDGNSYIIACDRAWRWSKCNPLRAGEVFSARFTGGGIDVQAVSSKGKEESITYKVLQSRAWR
jgi:hypothetical protein